MITRRKALTLTALGLVAAGGYGLSGRDNAPGLARLGAANAQGSGEAIQDIVLGSDDAPVKVVEYASFTCPHCASFHAETFKPFKRDYIDTGKVQFTFREVYFDRYGLWASMVARCAGPDRYMGVADVLFSTLGDWARQGDPAVVADSLKRIGAQAGLSQEQLDTCLADADMASDLVAWYEANAARDNIRATPSFLIDGQLHTGSLSLAQIGALVDEAS
ncbi:DsbA family protein [Jannaschia rubra]|uniref:Thiol-disulfide oxidoreductase D n=1 Tax=Jannaschia rubra TaxID=282197 RepID=A0A0M6XPG8_9RHOB|nr:DsbA family protein [Jannaschia rubra]CTQ32572.1 Thiol-disulfide oxidoreductase D [Jannaschia rubra]SFF85215.1 Protein-disulfide isomerase [Jannaschia rubra]